MGVSLSAPILDDYRQFSKARILNRTKVASVDSKRMTKIQNRSIQNRPNLSSGGKLYSKKIQISQKIRNQQYNQNINLLHPSKLQKLVGNQNQTNSPIKIKKLQNKQYSSRYQRLQRPSILNFYRRNNLGSQLSYENNNDQPQICHQKDIRVKLTIQPQNSHTNKIDQHYETPKPHNISQKLHQPLQKSPRYTLPQLKFKHFTKKTTSQSQINQEPKNQTTNIAKQSQIKAQKKLSDQNKDSLYSQSKAQPVAYQLQPRFKNNYSLARKKKLNCSPSRQLDQTEDRNPQFNYQSQIITKQQKEKILIKIS